MSDAYILALTREPDILVIYSMNGTATGDELFRARLVNTDADTIATVVANIRPYLAQGKAKGATKTATLVKQRRPRKERRPRSDPRGRKTRDEAITAERLVTFIRDNDGTTVDAAAAHFGYHKSYLNNKWLKPLVHAGVLTFTQDYMTAPRFYSVTGKEPPTEVEHDPVRRDATFERRLNAIAQFIIDNPGATYNDIWTGTNTPRTAAQKDLVPTLLKEGLVHRVIYPSTAPARFFAAGAVPPELERYIR